MITSNKRLASLPTILTVSLLFSATALLSACGPKGSKKTEDDDSEEDDPTSSNSTPSDSDTNNKEGTGSTASGADTNNDTSSGAKTSDTGTASATASVDSSDTTSSSSTSTSTSTEMPEPKPKEMGDENIDLTWFDTGFKGTVIGSHALSATDVWLSGTANTILHTVDGGTTWTTINVSDAAEDKELQFRDIEAVSATTIYAMSAGEVENSRIYKSSDSGMTWTQQYKSDLAGSFFDCFDFWDENNGILFGDSVDNSMFMMNTTDGTAWNRMDPKTLPAPVMGEGAFAASGTCVVARGASNVWIGTGAGARARILKSTDKGATWTVVDSPTLGGSDASGVASLVFWSNLEGMAFGVNLADGLTGILDKTVAYTNDGGSSWTLRAASAAQAPGIFGAAANSDGSMVVTVGPTGMHYSQDKGLSWTKLSDHNFWTVSFGDDNTAYAAGQNTVVKLTVKD